MTCHDSIDRSSARRALERVGLPTGCASGRTSVMSAIPCRLFYGSVSPNLQQLYTGYLLLAESGIIRLSQQRRRTPLRYSSDAPHLRNVGHAHLDVLLNGDVRIHFDTHDAPEIAEGELDHCDFYFKRSYSPVIVDALPNNHRVKVFPLGLNYRVLTNRLDWLSIVRGLSLHGLSAPARYAVRQALDSRNRLRFEPRLAQMEAPPDLDAPPKVLFQVSAFDPYDDPQRSQQNIEDRIHVNETRAGYIRILKRALGDRFRGGFSRSAYTLERYADLVIPEGQTCQENYLQTLRSFPICVATTGLHGSTGWKLAEYVAFGKAILSEPLLYDVPPPFDQERNYLAFTTPRECLGGAVRLIEDAHLRHELMRNNAAYYRSHLRPDVLVKNALMKALSVISA